MPFARGRTCVVYLYGLASLDPPAGYDNRSYAYSQRVHLGSVRYHDSPNKVPLQVLHEVPVVERCAVWFSPDLCGDSFAYHCFVSVGDEMCCVQ